MSAIFHTSLGRVAVRYVERLHIPLSSQTLLSALEENPYYPSLFSLSDTFNRFNIPNGAFRLRPDELDKTQPPFIAYLKEPSANKDFVLVTNISNNEVSYLSDSGRPTNISKGKFLELWEEVIFVSEKTDKSGERNYRQQVRKEKLGRFRKTLLFAGAMIILFLAIAIMVSSGISTVIAPVLFLLATKVAGLAAAVLLLTYETGQAGTFLRKFCTIGPQSNCDAVLNSKAAKIAGLTWSEAGFIYFTATMLFLLLPGISFPVKTSLVSLAAVIVSPYIIFSLYYQWRVVKHWCPLCLAVQAILLAELVLGILFLRQVPVLPLFDVAAILSLSIAILIPIIGWFSLKPVILKAREEKVYRSAYKRLLYNPETFNYHLRQQPSVPEGHERLGIMIGNPQASNTIIKICNPYCGPCADAHPVLEEIIHHNADIRVKLIFLATNNPNDRRGPIAKHLLAIAAKGNASETNKALHEWYAMPQKNYEHFALQYPLNGELKAQEQQVDEMNRWCTKAGLRATPTFFINGKRLPDSYSIEELKNIL